MNVSLSSFVDNLSGVNNKKPENKFLDTMKSMNDSLSCIVDNLSEINKKEHTKLIDNMRSMASSLLQSIDKVSEINKKITQIDKNEHDNKFEDSMRFMIDSLIQSINKISQIDKKISYASLIEKFHNTYQLCNNGFNKFDLLLRKGVHPYEYMDRWKRFKEDKLPDKQSFYSELNKEHITDSDSEPSQKVYDTFNIKNLSEYHDLYVQLNLQMYLKTLEIYV